jgi:hypothetical protein
MSDIINGADMSEEQTDAFSNELKAMYEYRRNNFEIKIEPSPDRHNREFVPITYSIMVTYNGNQWQHIAVDGREHLEKLHTAIGEFLIDDE